MDLKISDLPPQFENIANRLGIEKAKWLATRTSSLNFVRG